ncbi:MAG: hypothetical protein PVI92_15460, partial [Chromatiales bacterium]
MQCKTKLSLNIYFRWKKTRQWLCEALTVVLAVGMLGIISATPLSAVELVSVNKDGTDSGSDSSYVSSISADGRFVTFRSAADDLAGTDTNGEQDVFARDLQ